MARLPLTPLFLRAIPVRWILSLAAATTLLAGCASLPDFSALENDELYLSRGEEFITDSKYLAFAMEQAGVEDLAEDDYYDANRSAYGEGYVGGYGGPGFQPSFNNPYRPFSNGLGLQSYFNPMSGYGMGMGDGLWWIQRNELRHEQRVRVQQHGLQQHGLQSLWVQRLEQRL